MSHKNINQSAISTVRDQLSLDFAEGAYLNIVGQNLGLNRPVFGFSDDSWRALVKTLALDFKQIVSKFHDVFSIMFGPRITEVGILAQTVSTRDKIAIVNDSSRFPQLGTLVFDEGLATEETLVYDYIDHTTNTIYFTTPFAFDHVFVGQDVEEAIITTTTSNEIVCINTNNFPETNFPYPVILGRGTSAEEVVSVVANNPAKVTLTLAGAPLNIHAGVASSHVFNQLKQKYFDTSSFVLLSDSSKFPSKGIIKLFAVDSFTTTVAGSGLSDKTVTLAASIFISDSLVGYEIVFDGTPTAGLAGVSRLIVDNTDSVITLNEDFTTLGVFPQINDTFVVHPIVGFVNNEASSGTLTLNKVIVEPLDIPINSIVELLDEKSSVALSTIKFAGTGWDVIQSTPRVLEIFIPKLINDKNDLRSAYYIHDDTIGIPATTTSVNLSIGDTDIPVVALASFPDAGVVELDTGGANEERLAYGRPVSYVNNVTIIGSNTLKLKDSSLFPSSGTAILNEGAGTEETLIITANDTATNTLSLFSVLAFNHKIGEVVKSIAILKAQSGVINNHLSGVTASFYQPEYASTVVPIGDFNQVVDTYPSGYVYELGTEAPTGTVATAASTDLIPGPTVLSIGQMSGKFAIEVENALPMLPNFSKIVLGAGTGARETLTVTDINIKNRAITTVAANAAIGDTILEVTALSLGPSGDGADFPNTNGYRVGVGLGPGREIVYVTGTLTSPTNRLVLESPLTNTHIIGESVYLVADVLTVTSINKNHTGLVNYNNRSTALAGDAAYYLVKDTAIAEKVNPKIDSITLANVTGLDITGGRVLLNFGYGQIKAEGVLSFSILAGVLGAKLVDSSAFPTTFPYIISLGVGKSTEERLIVTSNAGNIFSFAGTTGTQYNHDVNEKVVWVPGNPEAITYNSISGNNLRFSPSIVVQYTHSPAEAVIASSADSNPRTDGFDFPLRLPVDILFRLQYLLDLVRAAGVQVLVIKKR